MNIHDVVMYNIYDFLKESFFSAMGRAEQNTHISRISVSLIVFF
jgi:hypothetical protein